jgi:hypothetical protein
VRSLRTILAAAIVAAFALAVPASDEKTGAPVETPDTPIVQKAEPTTAGTFDGTWMYMNRDLRFALWIRTKDGVQQVRLQYQSLSNPEAFETGWDGKAVYYLASNPVTFELKLGKSNDKQLTGAWAWDLQIDQNARRETADVVIYRTQYGRTLLMDFQNFQRVLTRNGKDAVMKVPFNWTWNKVSNRELLWDELPF